MNKIIVVLVLIAIAGGIVWILGKQAPSTTGLYSDFLPESSMIVVNLPCPEVFLQKFDAEKHRNLIQLLSMESMRTMGFDITNAQDLMDKGVDLKKPCGFAMADVLSMTMVFFVGVKDEAKFRDFVENKVFKDQNLISTKLAGVPCLLEGDEQSPEAIHCYQSGYWFVFGTRNFMFRKDLPQKFSDAIEGSKGRLSQYAPFVECEQQAKGDLFFYMDYPNFMNISMSQAKLAMPPEQHAMIDNMIKLAQEFTGLGVGLEWAKEKLIVRNYMGVQPNSQSLKFYQAAGNCADILQKMKPDPLVSIVNITDMGIVWAMNKQSLNMFLQLVPATQKYKNIEELFAEIQGILQKELNITVDFEKDLVQNLQGSVVLTLNSLPKEMKITGELFTAIKLKDPEKMAKLLQNIATGLKAKYPDWPIQEAKAGMYNAYYLDISKLMPQAELEPMLAVIDNYLIFVSRKAMVPELLEGKGSFLQKTSNPELAKAFQNGAPSAGSIQLAKLVDQSLTLAGVAPAIYSNVTKISNHFPILWWTSTVHPTGIDAKLVLEADDDIVAILLQQMAQGMNPDQEQAPPETPNEESVTPQSPTEK